MNRIRSFLPAALAVLAVSGVARAQAPPAPKAAAELPAFETAQTDATSWVGRFGVTNCAWFDMGDGVLILDTGATEADGRNLLGEVKRTLPGKPVKWVVMTHLHPDSNGGFTALMPTDVTLVVHQRALQNFTGLIRGATGKVPSVLGVSGTLALFGKTQTLEVHAVDGPAHTDHDLWLFAPASNIVFTGDLVTTARCPMMSDGGTDPKGWLRTLDKIDALHAAALVPTRGPSTASVTEQIKVTRDYVRRMLEILTDMKSKNAAEARVSGELVAKRVGDYCPKELDVTNALALYRRMNADGTFKQPKPAAPSAAPAKPAPKKG